MLVRKVGVEDIQSRKQRAELEIYIGPLDTCECYSSSRVSSRFEKYNKLFLREDHGSIISILPEPSHVLSLKPFLFAGTPELCEGQYVTGSLRTLTRKDFEYMNR